ncbi:MAG: hypothetical protein ACJ780_20270 [Solirubrobacteraceae bacterium]
MGPGTWQSTPDERASAVIGHAGAGSVARARRLRPAADRDRPRGWRVGKSTLVQAAAVDARARGTVAVALEGFTSEPTEQRVERPGW